MTRVCMGGTFDALHRGHRALLDTAFAHGDEAVVIGITTDDFANAHRTRRVHPYADRAAAVQAYLDERGYASRGELRPIETSMGFALEPQFTAIAATPETAPATERINEARLRLGHTALDLILAPYVLADDGRPIKATRIANGEIDEDGRLIRAARIAVGSENPVKVEAVQRVAARIFGVVEVRGFRVDSNVPEQPHGEATWRGAHHRARAALEEWPDADFGVGIEAGLFPGPKEGSMLDVQACSVIDAAARETVGHGPGFAYPSQVARELEAGRSVGDVVSELARIPDIGRKMGAIGWLTRGIADRTELTEPAVLMAFLPRLRPDAYEL